MFDTKFSDELIGKLRGHLTWGPKDADEKERFLALALAGEAGEVANAVKKEWRDGWSQSNDDKIDEEIVDVANYVFMLALHREIDLPRRMMEKLVKVEQRKEYRDGH
jgi:NTP pyrophosphatase (non-canonical NTP hydrolase)